jgi:hypothetical protein
MDDFFSDDTEQAGWRQRVLYVLAAALVLAAMAVIAVTFTI